MKSTIYPDRPRAITGFAYRQLLHQKRGASNQCALSPQCRLKGVLQQATNSYLAVLDGVTLADLIAPPASRSKFAPVAMPISSRTGKALT